MKNSLNSRFKKFSDMQLTKNDLLTINGGMNTEGRRQSCNVNYDMSYINSAFIHSLRCGGSQWDYIHR
jgi:hypothetical protein